MGWREGSRQDARVHRFVSARPKELRSSILCVSNQHTIDSRSLGLQCLLKKMAPPPMQPKIRLLPCDLHLVCELLLWLYLDSSKLDASSDSLISSMHIWEPAQPPTSAEERLKWLNNSICGPVTQISGLEIEESSFWYRDEQVRCCKSGAPMLSRANYTLRHVLPPSLCSRSTFQRPDCRTPRRVFQSGYPATARSRIRHMSRVSVPSVVKLRLRLQKCALRTTFILLC